MRQFLKPGALTLILLLLSTLLLQYSVRTSRAVAASPASQYPLLQDPQQVTTTPTDTTPTATLVPPTSTITPTATLVPPTSTITPTATLTPQSCGGYIISANVTDAQGNPVSNNTFPSKEAVYLTGTQRYVPPPPVIREVVPADEVVYYQVTTPSGKDLSGVRTTPLINGTDFFVQLVKDGAFQDTDDPQGQYNVRVSYYREFPQGDCTKSVTFFIPPTPTVTPVPPTITPVPPTVTPVPPTVTPVPPTAKPREPEPEPETKIVSIQLQVANGKIWGLLVAENPRAGRSVTLALEYRVPGPRTQQTGDDGYSPTGQTTTVAFRDDQTNYNIELDKPVNTPDNAEYRLRVEGVEGDVGGTDTTSLPVRFPPSEPTSTPQPQSPAPTQPSQAIPPTSAPPILGNVTVPSPTARPAQPEPAGGAAPDNPQQVLPGTGSDSQLLIPALVLVALIFLAAVWLLQFGRRPRKE